MNKNMLTIFGTTALMALSGVASAVAQPISAPFLHIVEEPRLVTTCSTKTERDTAKCTWCGSKIRYDRTYEWDVYRGRWNETTSTVPSLCRKCGGKNEDRQKLARKEAEIDRKIDTVRAQQRIKEKETLYRQLRDRRVSGR